MSICCIGILKWRSASKGETNRNEVPIALKQCGIPHFIRHHNSTIVFLFSAMLRTRVATRVVNRTIAANLSVGPSERIIPMRPARMTKAVVDDIYLRNDIDIERAGSGCITIEWIHVSVDVCNKNRHLLISAQKKFFFMDFCKWDKEWPIHEKKICATLLLCRVLVCVRSEWNRRRSRWPVKSV